MRTSAGLNVGAGGASAVSGSQTASDTAATTTRAKKPSKIRRSIVGPLRGRSARICDRPARRWQAADLRAGGRKTGAGKSHAKAQRRDEDAQTAKRHSHVRGGPPQCWKIKDLAARLIFFATLPLCGGFILSPGSPN